MPRPKGFLIDGRFLRAQRENAGLTQDELATRCQLTRSVVQKAERGGPLSLGTIGALSTNLGCAESSLIVSEDWTRRADERIISPFKPEAAPKIGTLWGQTREMLYHMTPLHLQVLALRNLARVLPAYSPRCRKGEVHFRKVVDAMIASLEVLGLMSERRTGGPSHSEMMKHADACYLAAGFTKGGHYEEDLHAADSAFAVSIGAARIVESILLERRRTSPSINADHWRAVELATTACHAAAHASVFLTVESMFLRAATLDTHDLRNSAALAVLTAPLWEGGQMPPPLKLYMSRFIREVSFPHEIRILWNRWVRKGFHPPVG